MNKSILLILTFSVISVLNTFSQVNLDSGLVGYWPFTENANDLSIGGHNGTVHGATLTMDRFNNVNAAYHFNGTSDYIYVTNSNLISEDQFSLSVWARGFGQQNGALVQTGNQNAYGIGYALMDSVRFFVYTNTSGYSDFLYVPLTNIGKWNNYILTYNGSNLKFYVNGVLSKTVSYSGNIWTNQASYLSFGAYIVNGSPYNAYFNGDLDDIRIYNRAINQAEVTALFNENVTSSEVNINITKKDILIYPNPTNTFITIDTKNTNASLVEIIDFNGNKVIKEKLKSSMDISHLACGIYIVKVLDRKGTVLKTDKIVKE